MKFVILFFRYLAVVVLAVISSYIITSTQLIEFYKTYFPGFFNFGYSGGSDINFASIDNAASAIFLTLNIFLPALTILLGEKIRYWVGGCVALILIAFDYFLSAGDVPMSLGLVLFGILIGWILRFAISNTLGNMSTFQAWKKYF